METSVNGRVSLTDINSELYGHWKIVNLNELDWKYDMRVKLNFSKEERAESE